MNLTIYMNHLYIKPESMAKKIDKTKKVGVLPAVEDEKIMSHRRCI